MARPIGIRIHKGADLIDTQLFERDIVKIGRLASAHLRLEDPKVSRIHAVIEFGDNKDASIIDMGSAEGTRVNGEKVSRVRLKHGDEIGLGDSRLVVILDDVELAAIKGGALASTSEPPKIDANIATATASGVFLTGGTDVAALRQELQSATAAGASSTSTDVFGGEAIDVSLNSLVPQAPLAPASTPPAAASTMTSTVTTGVTMSPFVSSPPSPAFVPAPTVTSSPPMSAVAPTTTPSAPPPSPPAPPPMAAKPKAAHGSGAKPAPVAPPPMAILPALPPIPEDAITPENRYVEVTLRWGGTVTDVKRIKNASTFSIGRQKSDSLFVPLTGASFNLLTSAQGQGWSVHWQDGMSGTVSRGEQSVPLSQAGGASVPLTDDTVVTISTGYHTIQVRAVPKSRIVPIVPFFDLLWANTAVVTLFSAAAMVAAVTLMPVGLDSLDDDLLTNPTKFQTLILKPPPKDNSFLNRLKGPKEQKQAAKNDQGKAGDKKADPKKDQGKMASKAKDKPTDEQVVANKMSALFGDKGAGGLAQIFGDSSGGALEAALGNIDGAKVASGYGTGGLGLRGGGPGGGGVGVGTLGTGKIGTRGRGSGDGTYGSGEGGLGAKTDRDVTMTQGTPVILGSLDPEIIRRIVREHAGQIRYCYEKELTRTPGIYGKIVMKWVINGEGKVTASQVAETQMKNANVEQCLATKIRTWVFPKPKGGGIVVVNYPFVFKQGG